MTDHPSNHPSLERAIAVVEAWETMEGETLRDPHRHTFERLIELEIDSALAAQEARHKAETEKSEQREAEAWRQLEALRAEYARTTAVGEDDAWVFDVPGDDLACVAEYRIRWLRVKMRLEEAESKLRQERDRCIGIVHSYGVGYPLGDIAAAIRSGEAQPPDKMAMGGSYKVALAAAFEAVKVLADYPPEQETPETKPPLSKAIGQLLGERLVDIADKIEALLAERAQIRAAIEDAPPAHGGGD